MVDLDQIKQKEQIGVYLFLSATGIWLESYFVSTVFWNCH